MVFEIVVVVCSLLAGCFVIVAFAAVDMVGCCGIAAVGVGAAVDAGLSDIAVFVGAPVTSRFHAIYRVPWMGVSRSHLVFSYLSCDHGLNSSGMS